MLSSEYSGREDDAGGFAAYEGGNLSPGLLQCLPGLGAQGIRAQRIPELLPEIRQHCLENIVAQGIRGYMVEIMSLHV